MLHFDAHIGWLFTELPFEERFAAAAEAGFKAVEHPNLYDYSAHRIADYLKDNGLAFVQTSTPTGDSKKGDRGLACRPERREEFRDGVGAAIEYAEIIECKILHVMAGLKAPDADLNAYNDTYVDNVRFAGRTCAEKGIKVIIEPTSDYYVPGFYLNTPNMAARALEDIDDENVFLLFDCYHAQCSQGNLVDFIRKHVKKIAHIQIADAPERNEPGSGEINYNYVLKTLDDLHYNGWIGCEYRPSENTEQSLRWLDPKTGKFEV
ncbi:MAG: TIM barrel protein [Rhodospirillales bacterium]